MLATNDEQVRRPTRTWPDVSVQLDGERDDLSAALKNLAIALNEVSTFVKDNRAGIKTNVDQLAAVTGTVVKQRDALDETLTTRRSRSGTCSHLQPRDRHPRHPHQHGEFENAALLTFDGTAHRQRTICGILDGLLAPRDSGGEDGSAPLNVSGQCPRPGGAASRAAAGPR